MVSHEDRKRERLSKMITAIDSGTLKEKLINDCIIDWGMSRRTILEYIKVIEVRHGVFE